MVKCEADTCLVNYRLLSLLDYFTDSKLVLFLLESKWCFRWCHGTTYLLTFYLFLTCYTVSFLSSLFDVILDDAKVTRRSVWCKRQPQISW